MLRNRSQHQQEQQGLLTSTSSTRTPTAVSNSASAGIGTPRQPTLGLNYQGSNYQILENRKSPPAELNSVIGNTMSNS